MCMDEIEVLNQEKPEYNIKSLTFVINAVDIFTQIFFCYVSPQ